MSENKEAGEVRGIALQAWEHLDRCVTNVTNAQFTPSSWVPALYGFAASAALGLIPLGLIAHGIGGWTAFGITGAFAIFSGIAGRIVQVVEGRTQQHYVSHTGVLRTEFDAAESYMVDW